MSDGLEERLRELEDAVLGVERERPGALLRLDRIENNLLWQTRIFLYGGGALILTQFGESIAALVGKFLGQK